MWSYHFSNTFMFEIFKEEEEKNLAFASHTQIPNMTVKAHHNLGLLDFQIPL